MNSRIVEHDGWQQLASKARVRRIEMMEHGRYPGHSISRAMSTIAPGEIASYFCDKCGLRVTPAQLPYLEARDGSLPMSDESQTMSAEELKLAKAIGEQMSGKTLCPRKCVEGQEMSTFGDFEDQLFCPHCEMEVHLIVRLGENNETDTRELV